MISLKRFREEEDFNLLVKSYEGREVETSTLNLIKQLDQEVLELKTQVDSLRQEKNLLSKNYSNNQVKAVFLLKEKLSELEEQYKLKKLRLELLTTSLPAVPLEDVPLKDKVVKSWGQPNKDKSLRSYLELSGMSDLIDFKSAVSCAGSGFSVYTDKGEKLIRALISLTLSWAEKHGFRRYYLPSIVNQESLFCTSQLSKFQDQLFKLEEQNKFLSPTAEVQLVNLFREQILTEKELPLKLCANTNCFRNEKIGAGTETKGIMRLFQFNKTELVLISTPEESESNLNYLSEVIEGLLQKLELPYRKVLLSRKELSFSSSKTYDFEVWMPSEKGYREISSLSNTGDFQALRGRIRYKKELLDSSEKSKYVHILNGSCLAIDRLFAAVLENHQIPEGEIVLPKCLVKHFGDKSISS